MGGGGGEFARAAAKMAVIGAVNTVVRGSPTVPQFGQFLRGSSKPASVFVGPSSPVPPTTYTAGAEAVMKPVAEIDDWEFANLESVGPKPRIVFGASPSFEEAKEATMEVKECLDRIYLSSSPEYYGSNLIISSVPQHANQAFRLLKKSAEAQTVVASIVSDTNVWNAMLSNEGLKSFLESYKTNQALECHKLSEEAPDVNHGEQSKIESRNVFHETIEYIKTSIDDMLATASSFLRKLFEFSPAEVSGNDKATSGYSSAEIAMGSSIMGLVVVVIAVLVAKRN